MNHLHDKPMDRSRQPLTWGNRLASLACIGLLWLMVRLVSELGGTGWEQAFWSASVTLGAYPATFSLLFSTASRNLRNQTWHRCVSFWVILFSFLAPAMWEESIKPSNVSNLSSSDLLMLQFFSLILANLVYYFKSHKAA